MFDNIDAFLFDMDGTLIDSMGVWREIDIEYLARYNQTLPDDLQKCIEGMCFHDTAIYMKKRFNIPDDIETIKNTWNEMALYKYSHSVAVKEGVLELLQYAKEKGIKTAIATSNSRILTKALLDAKGLAPYFDCVLTGCDSLKSKPDPEIYSTVAKRLNADPKKCIVFEDIVAGIMAGKNAGMRVVGVYDKYSLYCDKEKMELSDFYIYSYNDILNGRIRL